MSTLSAYHILLQEQSCHGHAMAESKKGVHRQFGDSRKKALPAECEKDFGVSGVEPDLVCLSAVADSSKWTRLMGEK